VLDEFQEVIAIDAGLMKLMRSVFQEQPEVAHVYLGSKRHMMARIFDDENEPFRRSAKQMQIGAIAPELFTSYAAGRFTQTGRSLGHAAAQGAMRITGGHPYATQELLCLLWERSAAAQRMVLLSRTGSRATRADCRQHGAAPVETRGSRLATLRWSWLSRRSRTVPAAVATGTSCRRSATRRSSSSGA